MKITKRGILATLLIFIAMLLGITTETGFSLGDKLLLSLGISPWTTNGSSGFHIGIIIWFVLFLIGILEVKREMSGLQILLLVLFIGLLSPWVLSSYMKPFYLGMQSGLAAVEYDSRNTQFRYKNSADGKSLEVIGAVTLTNYGDTPLYLSIKIPAERLKEGLPEEVELEESEEGLVLGGGGTLDSVTPEIFVLLPGEKETFLSYNTFPLKSYLNVRGSMQVIDLILFTDGETRVVEN